MAKDASPELYVVLRNIRYKHEGEHFRKLITPDMPLAKEGLPMDHLEEGALAALVRKGYVMKKTDWEAKQKPAK